MNGLFFRQKLSDCYPEKNNNYLWMTFKKWASFLRIEKTLKLIIKSVEKFNFKQHYLIFSSVLCCQFIPLALFFRSQKKQSEFKNLSARTCRSVNPTLRECHNNATSI